jgi:hypothetical protein
MSALGQKQTLHHVRAMSALPLKTNMTQRGRDMRFVPLAAESLVCPLIARSRYCGGRWI